jgi:hypothetical protein
MSSFARPGHGAETMLKRNGIVIRASFVAITIRRAGLRLNPKQDGRK